MSCQLFKTRFWFSLIFICGCSASDSDPSQRSTVTTSGDSATVSKAEGPEIRKATVDPAIDAGIDAGMMADEIELKDRLIPKPPIIREVQVETVPQPQN